MDLALLEHLAAGMDGQEQLQSSLKAPAEHSKVRPIMTSAADSLLHKSCAGGTAMITMHPCV